MSDHKQNAKNSEQMLVCLSSSPSNQKVIAAAAKMAEAFQVDLTAIYVKPSDYDALTDADKQRLQGNLRFAEQCGASITTLYGDDVPTQIAEYAHISGATKIVVGRSGARRRHFWSKPPLTEQLIVNAPDVDVYIIPDSAVDIKFRSERFRRGDRHQPTWRDLLITLALLAAATGVGLAFTRFGFSEANIITVFILGVLIASVTTVSPVFSVVSSLASVLLFNYFFVEPRFSFHFNEMEYLVTFGIMLASSLITGTLANRLQENAHHTALEAFRAKVLFDTNQLLQKADGEDAVLQITAKQITTLIDRDVIIYPLTEKRLLGDGTVFRASGSEGLESAFSDEKEIAEWSFHNQQIAGAGSEQFGSAMARYHPICINGYCYGVIGIPIKSKPIEAFEYSVITSILGECVLALDSMRHAREKEQAAVIAHNEQLRSNLLRSISHDIRTPLTSISGNASNLLTQYGQLDDSAREQIFRDIYDDSKWLIHLVENLLSISRIENGQMKLHTSLDEVNDVIAEALRHVDRDNAERRIVLDSREPLLFARMDSGLITQVLINLVNNALKYTPDDAKICVRSERAGDYVQISVIDDGPGIPDEKKPQVFEMFYTGQDKIADGRRGLGLGLALCRSIIEAHGGEITLEDNQPTGCCFRFTIPAEEVTISE